MRHQSLEFLHDFSFVSEMNAVSFASKALLVGGIFTCFIFGYMLSFARLRKRISNSEKLILDFREIRSWAETVFTKYNGL